MSDELAHDVVPYSAFLERRETRLRVAEDLTRIRDAGGWSPERNAPVGVYREFQAGRFA